MRKTKLKYSYSKFLEDVDKIVKRIQKENWNIKYVYGPPRGGCILAVFLSHRLGLKYLTRLSKNYKESEVLVVDDVADSGRTLLKIPNIRKYNIVTLFVKPSGMTVPTFYVRKVLQYQWIIYWWEKEYNEIV